MPLVAKQILSVVPRKRSQEEIIYSDGSREIRCYSPANPHYFEDAAGVLRPIDVGAKQAGATQIGAIELRSKNVASVGVRADGGREKVVGLRPDFSQATGEHQLEFSLDRVIVDGIDQNVGAGMKAPEASAKNALVWDMGRYQVIPNRRFCRQAVLIDRPKSSFRIEFTIHAKGLTITPLEAPGRDMYRVTDDKGRLDWAIAEPLILDGDFEIIGSQEYVTHSLVDNKDGTYSYVKESVIGADFSTLPEQFWVDASTVYSSTADGYARYSGSTSWYTTRETSTGTAFSSTETRSATGPMAECDGSGVYRIDRCFFYFDTSGISGGIVSVTANFYGYGNAQSGVSLYKGIQADTLSTTDYSKFSGSAFGSIASWSTSWNAFTLDATGRSDINTSGVTKHCLRPSSDVGNMAPATSTYYWNGIHYADYSGTTYDPYLSIVTTTTYTKGVSLDALIKKSGIAKTTSLNALVKQTGLVKSLNLDSYLAVPRSISTGLDAMVPGYQRSVNALLDALAQKQGITRTTVLDAKPKGTRTVGVGMDAILPTVQTITTPGAGTLQAQGDTAIVECWAAGAGARATTTAESGAGGGGGAYSIKEVTGLTPGADIDYLVGAGGPVGVNGGDTWFVSALTVLAKGGTVGSAYNSPGVGGPAASGVGDVRRSGGNGGAGQTHGTQNRAGGGGGSSAGTEADGTNGTAGSGDTPGTGGTAPAGGGNGGNGAAGTLNGVAGTAPGGGGGGGGNKGGVSAAGNDGKIKITWFGAAAVTKDVSMSLDAMISKQETTSISIDGLILADRSVPAGLDALAQQARSASVLADALIRRDGQAITVALEALVKQGGVTSATGFDACLSKQATGETSLDALVSKIGASVAALDANLKGLGLTVGSGLDAIIIGQAAEITISLDAAIKGEGLSVLAGMDAAVMLQAATMAVGMDALVGAVAAVETALDGLIQAAGLTSSAEINAVVQAVVHRQLELSACLAKLQQEAGAGVDAFLAATMGSTVMMDAALMRATAMTAGLDALLVMTRTVATGIDAGIVAQVMISTTMDAYLSGVRWQATGMDAVIWPYGYRLTVPPWERAIAPDCDRIVFHPGVDRDVRHSGHDRKLNHPGADRAGKPKS